MQLFVINYKERQKLASIIDISVSNIYQTAIQIQVITTLFAHVYCSAIDNDYNTYYNRNITTYIDNTNRTLITIKGLESMELYQIQCSIEDNSNNLQSTVSLSSSLSSSSSSSSIRTSCCKLFYVIPAMNSIITNNNYVNFVKFSFDRYPSFGVTIAVVLVSSNGTIYNDHIIPSTIYVAYDHMSVLKSLDYYADLISYGLGIL